MKAWQFVGTGRQLELNVVPDPTAGPGQIVIDVKAAGICHSDVSVLDDPNWIGLFQHGLPRTMGHENAGVVSEVGEGVDNWKVGDRVGMVAMMPDGDGLGYGKWDGGFAPKLVATDHNLVALPDEVPFDLAAMAADAGVTAYRGMVTVGGAKAGMKIGVIGLGGVGYVGARVAALIGAEVYGAEVNPAARKLADEIGLADVAESIDVFKDKELELIVDFAGFGTTTAAAIETLGEYGTLVQVGMGRLEASINTYALIAKQLTIKGTMQGSKQDLAKVYELMRSGEVNPPVNHIRHEEIPAAIDKLREGGVIGRFVAMYED